MLFTGGRQNVEAAKVQDINLRTLAIENHFRVQLPFFVFSNHTRAAIEKGLKQQKKKSPKKSGGK
ncbi:hypothetical protein L484_019752 [Morus notabilis]|uniref:Uncharacterized protein n=1 Tax=Morus notabilis TaxID=981085 RepID=W9R1X3_9ROSA|nr:hypothetical protein L484_019752 [Morus notabilis]